MTTRKISTHICVRFVAVRLPRFLLESAEDKEILYHYNKNFILVNKGFKI